MPGGMLLSHEQPSGVYSHPGHIPRAHNNGVAYSLGALEHIALDGSHVQENESMHDPRLYLLLAELGGLLRNYDTSDIGERCGIPSFVGRLEADQGA